eukprot:scaffold665_cov341-Prasinococcus_capsulatus_cf.AAC.15
MSRAKTQAPPTNLGRRADEVVVVSTGADGDEEQVRRRCGAGQHDVLHTAADLHLVAGEVHVGGVRGREGARGVHVGQSNVEHHGQGRRRRWRWGLVDAWRRGGGDDGGRGVGEDRPDGAQREAVHVVSGGVHGDGHQQRAGGLRRNGHSTQGEAHHGIGGPRLRSYAVEGGGGPAQDHLLVADGGLHVELVGRHIHSLGADAHREGARHHIGDGHDNTAGCRGRRRRRGEGHSRRRRRRRRRRRGRRRRVSGARHKLRICRVDAAGRVADHHPGETDAVGAVRFGVGDAIKQTCGRGRGRDDIATQREAQDLTAAGAHRNEGEGRH